MTQRSELKQRYLEAKAQLFGWLASKLFTYRETGVAGLVKKMLLPKKSVPLTSVGGEEDMGREL